MIRIHLVTGASPAQAGVAGVLLAKPLLQPDPGIDELMQPDVLSLMSMGEL